MKTITKFLNIIMVGVLISFAFIGCSQEKRFSQEESVKIAEQFVKYEATFKFDGIPATLTLSSTVTGKDGWMFTFQYDSRHAGFGDRQGQVLAEVITPHQAEVTVAAGQVTRAILDGQWDMIKQSREVEIKAAPIEEVKVYLMKSNPAQIGVSIKLGLSDGCTTLHEIKTTRSGDIVNIDVTVQRPLEMNCPAIYTTLDQNVNLGSDFKMGTTYTLNVNDYTTTFEGPN